jgi:hypothetical protein
MAVAALALALLLLPFTAIPSSNYSFFTLSSLNTLHTNNLLFSSDLSSFHISNT